jgi:HlyD family secretion protein
MQGRPNMPRLSPLPFTAAMVVLTIGCSNRVDEDRVVGTLEMVEVNVGPLQAARAVHVLVREGDAVTEGDTLAILSIPTLGASVAQAAARATAAREGARELLVGARPAELSRAEAEVRAAVSEADRAAADLARIEPLAQRGDISQAQLDATRNAARVAASRRDAAQQSLRLLREGSRSERRAAAQAESRAADAAADVIRATADDLVLTAPVSGIVTSRNVEPGEVLTPGGSAVTIGQPSRPWARVYVSQFVLPSLRVGDTVTAMLDRDTTRFRGRIASIASAAEYTPRVALTEDERADLMFGVRIEFDDRTGRLKAGLPVTVTLPRGAR